MKIEQLRKVTMVEPVSQVQPLKTLFESNQSIMKSDLEELVFKTKSKQFKFDCGIIMARVNIDINNKFGLKYHLVKSTNQQEFIDSVSQYVAISGGAITDKDKAGLIKQFDLGIKSFSK